MTDEHNCIIDSMEEFDKFACSQSWDCTRDTSETYKNWAVQDSFLGWQARQPEIDSLQARIAQLEQDRAEREAQEPVAWLVSELPETSGYLCATYTLKGKQTYETHGHRTTPLYAKPAMPEETALLEFLETHPECVPYCENGLWKTPYLLSNDGGLGGGVAERNNLTLREAIRESMIAPDNNHD